MTTDPFDPTRFGRPVSATHLAALARVPASGQLPYPAKGEQYLGGPIPLDWLAPAAELPGKALHLAIALWYSAVRSKGKNPSVKLTSALATQFGVGARTTRRRALMSLERAGLVSVISRDGRTPLVTILPAPRTAEQNE
ncbi:MAG: GntR family transcriptional regulator [Planctomycetes bacterium]|nr:GntR family transcriptional regulator [Planctomycetota bacterium]